ncbi:ABC transporter ATP-binding protein [Chitinispirillales bacterium ANBcel5]|uniref:ABC transporter ATP-binding protein n=1 Tax=Cellulosispirillum alkaliphilum TaxID=3039283 RepID=UPI002A5631C7|nr:ABC transporter ATP-binding protein [Chitinispirillales bacterium ANBcel5]
MSPVIQTIDLCKSYMLGKTSVAVLKDINLTVQQGDYTAIMGQSGAGKSTLLNILGCLDVPSSGQYLINGESVSSLKQNKLAEIRSSRIGFVFQNFNLLPKLDIRKNVELPLIYANTALSERREMVEKVMRRLGIWERRHHRPNEISGGQKQRVAIARALVKRPSIIFADEPTGNLDSHTTEEILAIFSELNNEGNTIVVITHEHEVGERAKKLIHLEDGRISA